MLQMFEVCVKSVVQVKMEKDVVDNEVKGKMFCDVFVKEKGVKIFFIGLFYKVEKEGIGEVLKDSDIVVVNYKGMLIDGKEFDNFYMCGELFFFCLDGVISGWIEGLKNIKKGGKIKLVILLVLVYGKMGVLGILVNFILVFDVELLDIKLVLKVDVKFVDVVDVKVVDVVKK